MSSRTYKHDELPSSVISLLESGKFVHLGTADLKGLPDVALMNYYYLPSHELYNKKPIDGEETGPLDPTNSKEHTYIILSTKKCSVKYINIEQNPNVSLLLHDWTTAKNLFKRNDLVDDQSNLFKILHDLNQSELSQVSATLSGQATILKNKDELNFYKSKLLQENPDAKIYIDGDENSIILVQILSAKVSDSEAHLSTYK
ncbi:Pyridoxamine 5'-phosphate oxidase [Wickerhamomyces ciferrii]|uniref:Pyridoxamine 5'-phosphate oxidase n=1 Tax=Wickerhamomyces ciferrii (strain ATCC 14091 / BCRC 22168 / CBS 111 / JCM 3599 / NBRC 0793 / NRRL Y-1031 F-60-10) TaxID=1206466 RepID=K0KKG2_WICCF|nr:Pyridoxamine 5'-phosphate oxidase [Wickerhamomyces ciferrii]CCH42647.1 Pyridoxamine 5'-phosphate oxidase [Wickerhamomyces ciferrii]